MAIDYRKYPANWLTEIRPRILARTMGIKPDDPGFKTFLPDHARCEWCGVHNYHEHPETGSRVILTIAHIHDRDPMNCADDNLAALCQKCHLNHDRQDNIKRARRNKRLKQIQAGQLLLSL